VGDADEDELRVAAWPKARRTWSCDQAALDRIRAEWAGLGAPTVFIPRVTLQKLIIEDMGIEQTVRALRRRPPTVTSCCRAISAGVVMPLRG
jgi:hypothetical protein